MKHGKIFCFFGLFTLFMLLGFQAEKINAQRAAELEEFHVPEPSEDLSFHKQINYPGVNTVTLKNDDIRAERCPDTIHRIVEINYPQNLGHQRIDDQIRAYAEDLIKQESGPGYDYIIDSSQELCDSNSLGTRQNVEVLYYVARSSPKYISVLFYYFLHGFTRPAWSYETFNFNLKTGKLITNEEILAGFVLPDDLPPYNRNDNTVLNLISEGELMLTTDGLMVICGPYSCYSILGLQSVSTPMSKEEFTFWGGSSKYWE